MRLISYNNCDYSTFEARINTFKRYEWINGECLAKAGFYFFAYDKQIKCYYCDFSFEILDQIADLNLVHNYENPHCSNLVENNIWTSLDMCNKKNRVRSLKKWPINFIDKEKLADCGFYYIGDGTNDILECYQCNNSFWDWKRTDRPELVHFDVNIKCNPNIPSPVVQKQDRLQTFTDHSINANVDHLLNFGLFCTGRTPDGCIELKCFACHYLFSISNINIDVSEIAKTHDPNCLYIFWNNKQLKAIDSKPKLYLDLLNENDRIRTLKDWPVFFMNLNDVAKSGFFYNGSGYDDVVECVSCKCTYKNFKIGDDPFTIHEKLSPNCYLKSAEPLSYNPTNSYYSSFKLRFESFKDWPKIMMQTPFEMAEAGFVFTKQSDLVFCYCCGLKLNGWLPGEDPWIKHCMFVPTCFYLVMIKGKDFINSMCEEGRKNSQFYTASTSQNINDMEHMEVDGINLCKICMVEIITTVFTPCGHSVACFNCANSVNRCPYCRSYLETVVSINNDY